MKHRTRVTCLSLLLFVFAFGSLVHAAATVSFWTQSATNQAVLQVLEQFTKETGIAVEVKAIDWTTDALFVAMAGGAPPDLFTHGAAALGAFAGQGVLTPLEPIISKWSFVNDMVPQIKAAGQYQGKQVAIPWNGVDVRDLIYRVDMFAESGLDPNQPPKSWADLTSMGRKLNRYKPDGSLERSAMLLNDGGTGAQQMFSLFHSQAGGDLLVNGQPALADGTAERALQFYVDLFWEYGLDQMGFGGTLENNGAVMQWAGYGAVGTLQDLQLDVKVATFPYDKRPATFLGANWAAIPVGATNPEGAAKLLEFLLRPANQQIMNAGTGGAVPFYRQSLRWDWVRNSPAIIHYFNALTYGVPNPPHPRWFDMRAVLVDTITAALKRQVTPAAALTQAQAQLTAIVNE